VDDESINELSLDACLETLPADWTTTADPPYAYQLFYFWANVRQLNLLRSERGLNTFDIRPHAGESGSPLHLATTYLLARGINHGWCFVVRVLLKVAFKIHFCCDLPAGINLQEEAVLEYLYYVDQIGIAVSPMSNNALFLKMKVGPWRGVFKQPRTHVASRRFVCTGLTIPDFFQSRSQRISQ
jgi:AMP deaminase